VHIVGLGDANESRAGSSSQRCSHCDCGSVGGLGGVLEGIFKCRDPSIPV
jgi:hypothetical protein